MTIIIIMSVGTRYSLQRLKVIIMSSHAIQRICTWIMEATSLYSLSWNDTIFSDLNINYRNGIGQS